MDTKCSRSGGELVAAHLAFETRHTAPPVGKHRGESRRVPHCRVPGCTADVAALKEYNRRYRICQEHHNAEAVKVGNGRVGRFCNKCGKFHDLCAFDGTRHTCRDRLNRHNERRRKIPATAHARGAAGATEFHTRDPSLRELGRILCSDDNYCPIERSGSSTCQAQSEQATLESYGSLRSENSVISGYCPPQLKLTRTSTIQSSVLEGSLLISLHGAQRDRTSDDATSTHPSCSRAAPAADTVRSIGADTPPAGNDLPLYTVTSGAPPVMSTITEAWSALTSRHSRAFNQRGARIFRQRGAPGIGRIIPYGSTPHL